MFSRFSSVWEGFRPQNSASETGQRPITYVGHKYWVESVAFSPDGNSVVSGSGDNTIRIWDAHRPSQIAKPLKGHSDSVTSVSCSPLGNIIASGSRDHTIRLWDMHTGKQIGEPLVGHNSRVNSVDFSPGGNLIASGSDNQTIRLWDVQRRTSVAGPFRGHSNIVSSIAFSPDGTSIVSGSYDETILVWDIEHGMTVLRTLTGHEDYVHSVALSPDGSIIVSGSLDATLRLWDTRSGSSIAPPYVGHTDLVSFVSFAPNGNYIASGSRDKTVRVWDVRAGRQMGDSFEKHTGWVHSVAISPCSTRIASGSGDLTIKIHSILNSDSNAKRNSHDKIGGHTEPFEVGSVEQVAQHMSIQDMFSILTRHGCIDLSSHMNPDQDTTVLISGSGGGFGDIWKAGLQDGTKVAIKVWRTAVIEQSDYKILKRTTREIFYWSKMMHENIHPLMGIVIFKGQSLGMVSKWMENGNLHEYMRRNPNVDRHRLCVQVASGLAYMHKHNMIHGDLKALNVLVSPKGDAKLTDFGLSAMSVASIIFSATSNHSGSIRWEAPELLSEGAIKTKQSDVYALAMTILEIFTENVPYPQCRMDSQVLKKVLDGILPTRPGDRLKDDLHGNQIWELLTSCWSRDPDVRPSAQQAWEVLLVINLSKGR